MKVLLVGPAILAVAAVEAVTATPCPEVWSVAEVLLVIGAIPTALAPLIVAWRTGQTNKAVAAVEAIPPQLAALTQLIDPQLFQQIADLKQDRAEKSGRRADHVAAEVAQVKADEVKDQQAKVAEVKQIAADAAEKKA